MPDSDHIAYSSVHPELDQSISKVLDLVVDIVPSDAQVELIAHGVGQNWRQRHWRPTDRVAGLETAFDTGGIVGTWIGSPSDASFGARTIAGQYRDTAVSLKSHIDYNGDEYHIPLINLHPWDEVELDEIVKAVSVVCEGRSFTLVETGRYFHIVGHGVISNKPWRRLLGRFLLPTFLVSPRYIGHVLVQGYSAVRVTSAPPWKPMVPRIIMEIDGYSW